MTHKCTAEYRAGYAHGKAGGSEPGSDKGASFWYGWSMGNADYGHPIVFNVGKRGR